MINERKARRYCRDDLSKIENYDKAIADTTQTWDLHHRLELTLDGDFALTREQLKMHDMYYHRPYYELIFLTHSEHRRLHMKNMSEEHRRKMSEALKGKSAWNKGKKCKPITEEHARKMHEAWKGKHHTEESRRKMSEAQKGRPSPRKGVTLSEDIRRKMSEAAKNMSEEHRRKLSESKKGEKNPNFGKKFSEEHRRKLSEAVKKRVSIKKKMEESNCETEVEKNH